MKWHLQPQQVHSYLGTVLCQQASCEHGQVLQLHTCVPLCGMLWNIGPVEIVKLRSKTSRPVCAMLSAPLWPADAAAALSRGAAAILDEGTLRDVYASIQYALETCFALA